VKYLEGKKSRSLLCSLLVSATFSNWP